LPLPCSHVARLANGLIYLAVQIPTAGRHWKGWPSVHAWRHRFTTLRHAAGAGCQPRLPGPRSVGG